MPASKLTMGFAKLQSQWQVKYGTPRVSGLPVVRRAGRMVLRERTMLACTIGTAGAVAPASTETASTTGTGCSPAINGDTSAGSTVWLAIQVRSRVPSSHPLSPVSAARSTREPAAALSPRMYRRGNNAFGSHPTPPSSCVTRPVTIIAIPSCASGTSAAAAGRGTGRPVDSALHREPAADAIAMPFSRPLESARRRRLLSS